MKTLVTWGIALAAVGAATAAAAQAGVQQVSVVRAPITAIAIGPTHASVLVNVNNGGVKHTVFVGKPLTAVSTPFWQTHIRVN